MKPYEVNFSVEDIRIEVEAESEDDARSKACDRLMESWKTYRPEPSNCTITDVDEVTG